MKNGKQSLDLLESVQKLAEVTVMHCRAVEAGKTELELADYLAGKAAKEASEKGILENKVLSLIYLPEIPLPVEKPK